MYNYKLTTLDNGLKILSIPNNKIKLTTIDIHLKLGNDSETTTNLLEISHFMEHLFCLFTSTKYPDGKATREYLSNNNIELDASVVNKHMMFTLEFKKKHTDYVLDLIINTIKDYKPDDNLFPQEKNAVIEELNDFIKDSDYQFETKINSIIFKGHQRAKSIKDRLNNCKKFTTKHIYNFYKTYFTPKNMSICLFGNYDTSSISLLKKHLSPLRGKAIIYKPLNKYHNTKLIYYNKESDISNLKILFNIPYLCFDPICYPINALIDILSTDLSSILLKQLRTEHGLVYSLSMDADCDEIDTSLSYIGISTLCNTDNILKVIKIIVETLHTIKTTLISKNYITKFIEQVDIDYHKEKFSPDPDDIINRYLHYLLWNKKIISYEEDYLKTKNINSKQLLDTANKIFDFNKMTLCYDGRIKLDKQINKICQCYS